MKPNKPGTPTAFAALMFTITGEVMIARGFSEAAIVIAFGTSSILFALSNLVDAVYAVRDAITTGGATAHKGEICQ